jgi:predicted RNA-binding protein associated with RNAse of E/G family
LGKSVSVEIYNISDLKQALKSGKINKQNVEKSYAKAVGVSRSFE